MGNDFDRFTKIKCSFINFYEFTLPLTINIFTSTDLILSKFSPVTDLIMLVTLTLNPFMTEAVII